MAIRPALRIGNQGDPKANPPRIPLVANAATIRKAPNDTIVTGSEAVRARMMVAISSAMAAHSAALRSRGDLITGYVWFSGSIPEKSSISGPGSTVDQCQFTQKRLLTNVRTCFQ